MTDICERIIGQFPLIARKIAAIPSTFQSCASQAVSALAKSAVPHAATHAQRRVWWPTPSALSS